jgi:hypothetical protein
MVIRYSFLWADEHRAGHESGSKDRPCAILVSVSDERDPKDRVTVLAITHSRPSVPDEAIEIPLPVKKRLGLDQEKSWIVLSEANDFLWPGPDLAKVGDPRDGNFVYGHLPPKFFTEVVRQFVELNRKRRVRVVPRTE